MPCVDELFPRMFQASQDNRDREPVIAIRGEFPDARIIVLTTYAGEVQVVRALKGVERGYLLKGNLLTDLLETIRAVRAGQKRIPPEVAADCGKESSGP